MENFEISASFPSIFDILYYRFNKNETLKSQDSYKVQMKNCPKNENLKKKFEKKEIYMRNI